MRISTLNRFLANNKYGFVIDSITNENGTFKRLPFIKYNNCNIVWADEILSYSSFTPQNSYLITNHIDTYNKYKTNSAVNIRYIPFYWSYCDYNGCLTDAALIDKLFVADSLLEANTSLYTSIKEELNLDCYENISYFTPSSFTLKTKQLPITGVNVIADTAHEYAHIKISKYNVLGNTNRYDNYTIANFYIYPLNDYHYTICDRTNVYNYNFLKQVQTIFEFDEEYKNNLYIVKCDKQQYLQKVLMLEDLIFNNLQNIEQDVYKDIVDIPTHVKTLLL